MTDIRALRLALKAAIDTSFRNNLEDVKIPAGFAFQIDDALREQEPEIVRCKDCKHYDHDTQSCSNGLDGIFLPDWFCADAERRDDDA